MRYLVCPAAGGRTAPMEIAMIPAATCATPGCQCGDQFAGVATLAATYVALVADVPATLPDVVALTRAAAARQLGLPVGAVGLDEAAEAVAMLAALAADHVPGDLVRVSQLDLEGAL